MFKCSFHKTIENHPPDYLTFINNTYCNDLDELMLRTKFKRGKQNNPINHLTIYKLRNECLLEIS